MLKCITCFNVAETFNIVVKDDHSRVRLEKNDINYINANFVEYPEANRKYILAQVTNFFLAKISV